MSMNLTISLTSIKKATVTFLHRFHIMIFVFIVLVGLIFIVYLLYNIVATASDTQGYESDAASTAFDEATIKRINELKSRDQSSSELDLSQGRTNPFVE